MNSEFQHWIMQLVSLCGIWNLCETDMEGRSSFGLQARFLRISSQLMNMYAYLPLPERILADQKTQKHRHQVQIFILHRSQCSLKNEYTAIKKLSISNINYRLWLIKNFKEIAVSVTHHSTAEFSSYWTFFKKKLHLVEWLPQQCGAIE